MRAARPRARFVRVPTRPQSRLRARQFERDRDWLKTSLIFAERHRKHRKRFTLRFQLIAGLHNYARSHG